MSTAEHQEAFVRIKRRLSWYYTRAEAELWLRSPQSLLNGARACDLINSGRAAEVERVLDQLDARVYL